MDVNIRPKYQEFFYLPVQSGIGRYHIVYSPKRESSDLVLGLCLGLIDAINQHDQKI